MSFDTSKRSVLSALDLSPKGGLDIACATLVRYINSRLDFCTLSSCSGRIAVFCEGGGEGGGATEVSKENELLNGTVIEEDPFNVPLESTIVLASSTKGSGRWLFVEHGPARLQLVLESLTSAWPKSNVSLLLEPFILHVQCRTLASAQALMSISMSCGFRESGIGVGSRGKIVVAIRTTSGMIEVPLRHAGEWLVPNEDDSCLEKDYLSKLLQTVNEKFMNNEARREKFFDALMKSGFTEAPSQNTSGLASTAAALLHNSLTETSRVTKVTKASSESTTFFNAQPFMCVGGCGVVFSSRNKLFKHLIPSNPKPICPAVLEKERKKAIEDESLKKIQKVQSPAVTDALSTASTYLQRISELRRAENKAMWAQSLKRVSNWKSLTAIPTLTDSTTGTTYAKGSSSNDDEVGFLKRWGHTAVVNKDSSRVIVFGGYVGEGMHRRNNDVVVFDMIKGSWIKPVISATSSIALPPTIIPRPRVRHAATLLSFPETFLVPRDVDTELKRELQYSMLVYGGHDGPLNPLDDLWLLSSASEGANSYNWEQIYIPTESQRPCARWGHTLTSTQTLNSAVLVAGRNSSKSFNDVWVFTPSTSTQDIGKESAIYRKRTISVEQVTSFRGSHPSSRFSHAAASLSISGSDDAGGLIARIVIHGGFSSPFLYGVGGTFASIDDRSHLPAAHLQIQSDTHILSIYKREDSACFEGNWSSVKPSMVLEPRFSHSLTNLGQDRLLILGGACRDPSKNEAVILSDFEALGNDLHKDEAISCSASSVKSGVAYGDILFQANEDVDLPPATCARVIDIPMPVRHSLSFVSPNSLVLTGGGGVCFAFGSQFSTPIKCHLDGMLHERFDLSVDKKKLKKKREEITTMSTNLETELVHASRHDRLPIKEFRRKKRAEREAAEMMASLNIEPLSTATKSSLNVSYQNSKQPQPQGPYHSLKPLNPHKGSSDGISRLRTSLVKWLAEQGVNANRDEYISSLLVAGAQGGLPKRIEWVGDILVLPQDAFTNEFFTSSDSMRDGVYDIVASVFKSERIARRATIGAESPTRDSRASMIRSQPFLDAVYPRSPAEIVDATKKRLGGFVCVRENGISYCFDVTRLMFSSGNVSEKARAAAGFSSYKEASISKDNRLPLEGEVVIDLFCGLGYFTLPVLIHAGAKKVVACDWNPTATLCLRANMLANGLDDSRCIVYEGDNRLMTLPERNLVNSADRVLLGLIPSSEISWETALRLLRPRGGWLHIHATKGDAEYEQWAFTELPQKLKELVHLPSENRDGDFEETKKSWTFTTMHLERVKSYAPKVWHLVADVLVAGV